MGSLVYTSRICLLFIIPQLSVATHTIMHKGTAAKINGDASHFAPMCTAASSSTSASTITSISFIIMVMNTTDALMLPVSPS